MVGRGPGSRGGLVGYSLADKRCENGDAVPPFGFQGPCILVTRLGSPAPTRLVSSGC